jgi:2-polyprenyl-3-methyl-5-hydroxy-6-metoxy-1,4-benzoquinol methylase
MNTGFHRREHCPLCHAENAVTLCELAYGEPPIARFLADFYHGRIPLERLQQESYRVASCRRCGFIYQDPILDDSGMQALYRDWVDNAQSLRKKQAAKSSLFRQYAGQVQTLLRMLPGCPGQVRLLEYGMGWGYWSRMAQAHGLDVTGFELSDQRRAHARAMGLKVITELPSPGAHFDCLYANQVFEHLPDPAGTLQQLCARLAPRALVYIRVPDGRGVANRLRRRGWSPDLDAIHPLEHINCFTRKTLIDLAAGAGLSLVQPPPRLSWGSLVSGIKREIADRYLTPHLFFRRGD